MGFSFYPKDQRKRPDPFCVPSSLLRSLPFCVPLLRSSAKARGSQIGKKRVYFNTEKATALRDQGWGQIRIAQELGIGVGRVNKWVREEYVPPERRT